MQRILESLSGPWAFGVCLLFLPVFSPPAIASDADVVPFFREDCEVAALRAIRKARKTILVAAYSLTSNYVVAALIEAKERGVAVKMKIDRHQSEQRNAPKLIGRLRRAGISVHTVAQPSPYSMHNKFLVIDGGTVLTGSYNFSIAAARGNWENFVRIRSTKVADTFTREWEGLRTRKKVNGKRLKKR
ncbi:MAG: endonuclease [Lentisphaeria bacterium]|nr:endonuclease [Lentisphaeria bacterium]